MPLRLQSWFERRSCSISNHAAREQLICKRGARVNSRAISQLYDAFPMYGLRMRTASCTLDAVQHYREHDLSTRR
jgi:hypothetical protein